MPRKRRWSHWAALVVATVLLAAAPALATTMPVGHGSTRPVDVVGQVAWGSEPGDVLSRPVAVAPVPGEVVRAFEQPRSRYGPGHRGVDLAVTQGQPVVAAMAGIVRFAGAVAGETWVTVEHAGGIETTYGGLRPTVSAGDHVELGQRLGVMQPGRSMLDWGARIAGDYIDPLGLLAGWRVRLVPVEAR